MNSALSNLTSPSACTAVVTKFSYNKKRRINAEVLFLTEEEWRQELEVLLTDLTAEDGSFPTTDLELAKLSLPARVAWDKVRPIHLRCPPDQLSVKLDTCSVSDD